MEAPAGSHPLPTPTTPLPTSPLPKKPQPALALLERQQPVQLAQHQRSLLLDIVNVLDGMFASFLASGTCLLPAIGPLRSGPKAAILYIFIGVTLSELSGTYF